MCAYASGNGRFSRTGSEVFGGYKYLKRCARQQTISLMCILQRDIFRKSACVCRYLGGAVKVDIAIHLCKPFNFFLPDRSPYVIALPMLRFVLSISIASSALRKRGLIFRFDRCNPAFRGSLLFNGDIGIFSHTIEPAFTPNRRIGCHEYFEFRVGEYGRTGISLPSITMPFIHS